MKEISTVKDINGEYATVYLEKKDQCSKCGMCLFPENAKGMYVQVKNAVGAKVGDKVIIETKESGKLLGIFLIFVVPLLIIGLAFMLNVFIKNETVALIISLVGIIIWYAIVSKIDKAIRKTQKFGAEILEIVK